jgi:hypothetical protein
MPSQSTTLADGPEPWFSCRSSAGARRPIDGDAAEPAVVRQQARPDTSIRRRFSALASTA